MPKIIKQVISRPGDASGGLPDGPDRAAVRNAHLAGLDGWVLFLEPWEEVENLGSIDLSAPAAYKVMVFQSGTLTREVRLWHTSLGLKFINPVYETVACDAAELSEVVIRSRGDPHLEDNLRRVERWCQSHPVAAEPEYYRACTLAALQRDREALAAAQTFFFRGGHGVPAGMLHYYCAQCENRLGRPNDAVRHLLCCVEMAPVMAEFWCSLGDIYGGTGHPGRAKEFYENAIILGSQRMTDDGWPMTIAKYRKYPQAQLDVLG